MKIFLIRFCMVSIAVLVGLILVEIILRLFNLVPINSLTAMNDKEFNSLPGIFSPGQDIMDKNPARLTHHIRINALGYRGPEIGVEKQKNEYRIFMTGDSFTFGDYVNDEETLPAQLQKSLLQECRNITVVNAGIGGSTITEQTELVKRAKVLQPDMVVLMFYENDIDDLAGVPLWKSLETSRRIKNEFPFSVVFPALHGTALWDLAIRVRGKLRALRPRQEAVAGPQNNRHLALRKVYEQKLSELAENLRKERIPFIFGVFPSHHTFTSSLKASRTEIAENQEWVLSMSRRLKLETINILPPLQKTGLEVNDLYLLPDDGHLSSKGYKAGAMEIAGTLVGKGHLPARLCK